MMKFNSQNSSEIYKASLIFPPRGPACDPEDKYAAHGRVKLESPALHDCYNMVATPKVLQSFKKVPTLPLKFFGYDLNLKCQRVS